MAKNATAPAPTVEVDPETGGGYAIDDDGNEIQVENTENVAPEPVTAPAARYFRIVSTAGSEVVKMASFKKALSYASRRLKVTVGLELNGVYEVVKNDDGEWIAAE